MFPETGEMHDDSIQRPPDSGSIDLESGSDVHPAQL